MVVVTFFFSKTKLNSVTMKCQINFETILIVEGIQLTGELFF